MHVYAMFTSEKAKKMAAVYRACEAADVDIPDDVDEFFGHVPPSDDLEAQYLQNGVREIHDPDQYVIEIDLSKLPKGTSKLLVKHSS
jgi:hypothetical protein